MNTLALVLPSFLLIPEAVKSGDQDKNGLKPLIEKQTGWNAKQARNI